MDQPGEVANPARGQLNRENNIPLSPCVPENLVQYNGGFLPSDIILSTLCYYHWVYCNTNKYHLECLFVLVASIIPTFNVWTL